MNYPKEFFSRPFKFADLVVIRENREIFWNLNFLTIKYDGDSLLNLLILSRCGIPVILMGETGCGKTRLIKYMCDLRVGASRIRNMVLIKVCIVCYMHG